jgi:hypothetical protein
MLNTAQKIEKYGDPGDTYLVSCKSPFPLIIAWDKTKKVNAFKCHCLIKDRLEAVLNELLEHYGIEKINELGINLFGGCYNYRKMRGGKAWSSHAWGIAIDLDPERNGLKTKADKAQFAKPEYRKMFEIFGKYDFVNYGIEKGHDFMHFETKI